MEFVEISSQPAFLVSDARVMLISIKHYRAENARSIDTIIIR